MDPHEISSMPIYADEISMSVSLAWEKG